MRWWIAVLIALIIAFVIGLFFFKSNNFSYDKESGKLTFDIPSEKSFYKKSDLGTDVVRLTNDPGNDGIFYQEPSYFSDNGRYFLFKSERDGKNRLIVMDLETGNMAIIKKSPGYGWAPSWLNNKVYVGGFSDILVIDIENYQKGKIKLNDNVVPTFIHFNPKGDKMTFVEELFGNHEALSVIDINGENYKRLFVLDKENEFYLDHPTFINDNEILFLTKGEGRDFRGDYNKPYIININGSIRKLPTECSHYDVNPLGDKILCAGEGYIIDLYGNKLKDLELRGHGVWHPDGNRFLMTGDPIPVPSGIYFGKIVIINFSGNETISVASHESTYDSTLEVHIQPNAHFSRDGKYIIYESDLMRGENTDLYLVEVY